jgi:DNA-binding transcriptional LysR family regulator
MRIDGRSRRSLVMGGEAVTHRDAVALGSLRGEPWTTGHTGMGWEEMTQRTCRTLGGFGDTDIRYGANVATVRLALVARGLAVTLLPELVLAGRGSALAGRPSPRTVSRRIFAARGATDAARPVHPGTAHLTPSSGLVTTGLSSMSQGTPPRPL